MSKGSTLLNSLVNNNDIEGHIIVNKDRTITVPEKLKRIAMQGETNIETITFDLPRYWDGYDLSTFAPGMACRFSNGELESWGTPNKPAYIDANDSNLIHYDWSITQNFTRIAGPLEIQLTFSKQVPMMIDNIESLVDVIWKTDICRDMYISESLQY